MADRPAALWREEAMVGQQRPARGRHKRRQALEPGTPLGGRLGAGGRAEAPERRPGARAEGHRGWVVTSRVKLREAPCLEVYLNDPKTTREEDLLTEFWVPIE
jgi:GyrI-like small molecule binding domain